MFREHEKFWAFVVLVLAIVVLALIGSQVGIRATTNEEINQAAEAATLARLRILDGAVVGLIGIAGMAAQALFRTGSTEKALGEIAGKATDKLPPPTGEAAESASEGLNGGGPGAPTVTTFAAAPGAIPEGPIEPDDHLPDSIVPDSTLPEGAKEEVPSWERPQQ